MPLVLGGSAVVTSVYSVDNSCRFNTSDSPYLQRTTGATFTSNQKFTFSCWIKLVKVATSDSQIFTAGTASPNERVFLYVQATGGLTLYGYSPGMGRATNGFQLLKDISAWYNLVFVVDTTESTAGDRQICYINGYRVPNAAWANYGDYGLNDTLDGLTSGKPITIGARQNVTNFWDGYMAEVVFIDGLALTASSFGEYNEASPTIWQPKDPTDLTFGTNGFWLDFKDSADLGNDVSGNNNDMTATNLVAADMSQDSPTNNFPFWNELIKSGNAFSSYINGNTRLVSGSNWCSTLGTLGFSAGKFYWEFKGLDSGNIQLGVGSSSLNMNDGGIQDGVGTSLFSNTGGGEMRTDGSTTTNDYGTFTSSDVMGVAVNMDDKEISIYKNGSAIVTDFALSGSITLALPFASLYNTATVNTNFGNGCFDNTVVTSAESDANGYGLFEHAPPTGYLALCTKNLGSDGG